MKKFILFLVAFITIGIMTSCESCKSTKEPVAAAAADSTVVGELVVENLISTDRQDMFLNYKNDYRWYETCILLANYLDEENSGEVAGVSNVFQIVEDYDGKSADVKVILFSHVPGADSVEVKSGFWVEDFPLNEEKIKVTFKEAFEKVMEVNLPKPHSRHCVLRKQVGPKDANPQYIFGNTHAQIYVDATTGAVSDKNPAFDGYLGGPLGEWP